MLTLVEGQTEERFVKDVLAPHLFPKGLIFENPTVLMTKRVLSGGKFRGGVTGFGKFENDLRRLLHASGGAVVTTMLDYYRLPDDFPGMSSRPGGTAHERVQHVETAIRKHFGFPAHLVPYLSLHEFEALLFVDPAELARSVSSTQVVTELAAVRAAFKTPEDINERPGHAPSDRILGIVPGYRKVLHGPPTVQRIGFQKLRADCLHFHEWLRTLEELAS